LRKSPEFLALKAKWYQKLADSGFVDIEDDKENLKIYDRRTIAFTNRERISRFFIELEHYVEEHPEIPERERITLILYGQGIYMKKIAEYVSRHYVYVWNVIKKYKKIIYEKCENSLDADD